MPSNARADADRSRRDTRAIAHAGGRGSIAERAAPAVRRFSRRATPREQEFLARLLLGELRQGALEGLMIDAVAAAAGVPAATRAARGDGRRRDRSGAQQRARPTARPDLSRYRDRAFSTARADARAAGGRHRRRDGAHSRTAALEWKLDGARVQVHKDGERRAHLLAHRQRRHGRRARDRGRGPGAPARRR